MTCKGGTAADNSGEVSTEWNKMFWVCTALNGFVAIEQDPPKGCLKLMEQGVAAAGADNA